MGSLRITVTLHIHTLRKKKSSFINFLEFCVAHIQFVTGFTFQDKRVLWMHDFFGRAVTKNKNQKNSKDKFFLILPNKTTHRVNQQVQLHLVKFIGFFFFFFVLFFAFLLFGKVTNARCQCIDSYVQPFKCGIN